MGEKKWWNRRKSKNSFLKVVRGLERTLDLFILFIFQFLITAVVTVQF
jgi:hypothetical protein